MPTLDEMRKWARGEATNSLPERPFAIERQVPERTLARAMEAKAVANKKGGRYNISTDGNDAMLLFGEHSGKLISAMVNEQPKYLHWIMCEDFADDLKDVIRYQMKMRAGRRKPRGKR